MNTVLNQPQLRSPLQRAIVPFASPPGVCHQGYSKHYQENNEENFGDPTRRAGDSSEAENAGHDGHEQKD
jgi:hypothetical protein